MSKRAEWDPLHELQTVQKRMNQLFESALARSRFDPQEDVETWKPVCDVYSTTESLVLCLELPGFEQEQIELRVEDDELVVEGGRSMEREQAGERFHRVERSFGKFSRRFPLPSIVDRAAVQANYRDGLLRIELPRKRDAPAPSIKVAIR